jgi:spore coat protein JB
VTGDGSLTRFSCQRTVPCHPLLKKLQASDFALVEIGLYLDTHPDDKAALSYYAKFLAVKKQLCDEYNKKYGPGKMDDYDGGSYTQNAA